MVVMYRTLALLIAAIILAGGLPCLAQQPQDPKPDKAKIQELVKALGSDLFEVRELAGQRLVAVGDPALAALREATRSPDLEVRLRAAQCIKEIEQNLTIARLIGQLQAKRAKERAQAADRLWEYGPKAGPAVAALIRAIDDPDEHVRCRAITALAIIGPAAKAAVPRLIAIAEDAACSDNLRYIAVSALSDLGEAAAAAVPSLLKLAKSNHYDLTMISAYALGQVGKKDDRTIIVLLDLLKHKDLRVRGRAAAVLGYIGKQPDVVVPAILDVLRNYPKPKNSSNDSRGGILYGLRCFGSHAKPAIPLVLKILRDTDPVEEFPLRMEAVRVFHGIGKDAREVVPLLVKIAEEDPFLQMVVKEAIEAITMPK